MRKRVVAGSILFEQDLVEKSDKRAEGIRAPFDGWPRWGCGRRFIEAIALSGDIFYVERVSTEGSAVRIVASSSGCQGRSEGFGVMKHSTV